MHQLLIPPARHGRHGKPSASSSDGLRAAMQAKLANADGKALYALCRQTIEPVFGQIKDIREARRFLRRRLAACEAKWKLLCGTTTSSSSGAISAADRHPRRSPPEWWRRPPSPAASIGSPSCPAALATLKPVAQQLTWLAAALRRGPQQHAPVRR